jgi:hypothetical protein
MNPELVPFAREALAHALGNFYLGDHRVIKAVAEYLVTGDADCKAICACCSYPEPHRTGSLDNLVTIVLGFLCGIWTRERYGIPVAWHVMSLRRIMRLPNPNQSTGV